MSYQQKTSTFCIVLFTILTTLLFLLYSSIHNNQPDGRIKQIGFVNEAKKNSGVQTHQMNSILNVSKIYINLVHFELLEFTPIIQDMRCKKKSANKQNSFLLINVNTKNVGLKYLNLLKTLTTPDKYQKFNPKNCINFRIFILKEKSLLELNKKEIIPEYVEQIHQSIYQVSKMTTQKFDILTSEQGSAFVLKAFTLKHVAQMKQIRQKLEKIILINLYNLKAKIMEQPSYLYMQKIKGQVVGDDQTWKMFNQLNLIMINTLKQQYQKTQLSQQCVQGLQHNQQVAQKLMGQKRCSQSEKDGKKMQNYFFVFQNENFTQQADNQLTEILEGNISVDSSGLKYNFQLCQQKYLSLNNTLYFHTRQMFNIHSQLNDRAYFVFQPFLSILSQFIKQNNHQEMPDQAVEFYFRYGQSHIEFPLELMQRIDIKKCINHQISSKCNQFLISEPVISNLNKQCFRLNIKAQFQNHVYSVYSNEGNFDVYSSSLLKIQQYDNNFNRSLYVFQKMEQDLLIYNPDKLEIYILVGHVFSPFLPLTQVFSQFQILYMDQIQQNYTKRKQGSVGKFFVRTCSGDILIFPDYFPVGKLNRQFLLQSSNNTCYSERGSYDQFVQEIVENWVVFRNLVFFTLFYIYVPNKVFSRNITTIFVMNYLFLYDSQLRNYHNIIIMLISFIFERLIRYACLICSYIHIDRNKVFICMVLVFLVAFICESLLFHQYNYWKILLIFLIFFIKKENVVIVSLKLYFLSDSILYRNHDLYQIVQMIIFLQCYRDHPSQTKQERYVLNFLQDALKSFSLIYFCILIFIDPQTGSINSLINYYMGIKIFLSIFEKLC